MTDNENKPAAALEPFEQDDEYKAFVAAHRASVLATVNDPSEEMILWHANRHWNGKPGEMWRARAALTTAPSITTKDIEFVKDLLLWPVTEDDARAARDMLQSMHFDLSMNEPATKASAVPEGWKLVPKTLTFDMRMAFRNARITTSYQINGGGRADASVVKDCTAPATFDERYAAMLAAAPSAPQAEEAPSLPDWLKLEGDTITIHGIRYATELFANFADALPIGEQFSIVNREKDGAITICRTAPTATAQPSIETCPMCKGRNGGIGADGVEDDCIECFRREVRGRANGFNPDWNQIQAAQDSIREHMGIAREAIVRAEKAEAQLAAIRAGLEGLNRWEPIMFDYEADMDQDPDGAYLNREDVFALLEKPE